MKKRLFSMLLSIAMIIGMFPVISSAAKLKLSMSEIIITHRRFFISSGL